MTARLPAVAGMFYPGDPETLRQQVDALLAAVPRSAEAPPKALIVPHAGYIYSGSTAAKAYASVAAARGSVRRVVLLGPTHRVAVQGIALPEVDAFDTPLGRIPLDPDAVREQQGMPQIVRSDHVHAQEHSLEVHLPFLQRVLGDFSLVPLAVGNASPEAVADVIDRLWGGPETLIVISSDLSHFHAYDVARQLDSATCDQILALDPTIRPQQACGAFPVNGLLLSARRRGMLPRLLGACNSGDTAGDPQRVVGYASFMFTEGKFELGPTLLALARNAIAGAFGRPPAVAIDNEVLHQPGATFVTLTQNGRLRGCIGSLEAQRSLIDDVMANAKGAAFRDPRFTPLTATELANTRVEVSLLTAPEAMHFTNEAEALSQLRPGVDGVLLTAGGHRATYLPQVWEQLPEPAAFLRSLKQKAGLAPDYWGTDVCLQRYAVEKWKEPTT